MPKIIFVYNQDPQKALRGYEFYYYTKFHKCKCNSICVMALQPKWDARPPARRTDTFSKSDNNTLRQILAEGKNGSLAFSVIAPEYS